MWTVQVGVCTCVDVRVQRMSVCEGVKVCEV